MCFNNIASYRKSIYKMIDKEFDCDWFIEINGSKVKPFSESELRNVHRLHRIELGPFYWERGLLKLLRKDYDIYFMYGTTRNLTLLFFCAIKKLLFSNKRVYFWTHGYYGKENKLELLIWKRPLFKLPDGLFTYGDYAKEIMVSDGFEGERIFPIHNSLDYDTQMELRNNMLVSDIYKQHFKNSNKVIVFIGRLMPIKKLDMLIDSVGILKNKGELYNVIFIGDGPERHNLENRVKSNNLNNQVWFYGESYDEEENANLVYNADVCVAPGNIGLTAVHCLMFGCPAISHDNFKMQMPEFEVIKPGKTGDFYHYGSTESLADTISNWFLLHFNDKDVVRKACYEVIDSQWNPYYQIDILRKNLK